MQSLYDRNAICVPPNIPIPAEASARPAGIPLDTFVPSDVINIPLRELSRKLRATYRESESRQTSAAADASAPVTFRLRPARVDGLVVLTRQQAETDRYRFQFSDGNTFRIADTWTGVETVF
jgi:hypothetical protein